MRSHRHTALVVAAAGLALLTGCSSSKNADPAAGGSGGSQGAAPALTATPTPTSVAETQQLPLRAYAASQQELTGIARAQGLLTQDCMKQLGFASWQPTATDLTKAGKDDLPTPYGFLNEAQAAQYGFHLPSTVGAAKPNTGPMNPAEFSALSGLKSPTGGEPAGGNTPPGGCTGEADRKLKNAKTSGADVYGDLTGQSMNRTKADPRVVAATAEWATCMKQKGYVYSSPESLTTESWGATVTQREIDTAKADVACTKQTNLSGIAFGVQSAIQQQLIEQHANELKAYRSGIQAQIDQAATVLREHGQ
ncbi:hypothetical protein [Streptomyces sp. CBMA156]|uniref:hypothetical protein n=1 Tax=Streptomyces sp. CBMA156 TaxID=1930280 RepID=UPI001662067E|nr:hypothetical protein [Streptomyces sp. CBMA156]MBD0675943.1 hypothetical protein [Streptomyces sp. CBMA156]